MKSYLLITALLLSGGLAIAQTPDDSPRNSLSGEFLYGIVSGRTFWYLDNAAGYGIRYSYQPRHWLALEAGLEQVVRPTGSSVCCRYASNADDQLYLVPFGARYVFQPRRGRLSGSLGGGGAYANHAVGNENLASGLTSDSSWGVQAVAGADFRLTRSGRASLGLQARFYYLPVSTYQNGRIFTLGPLFTYSWR